MGTFSLLGSEILNHRHRSDPVDNKAYSTSLQTINKIDSIEKGRPLLAPKPQETKEEAKKEPAQRTMPNRCKLPHERRC